MQITGLIFEPCQIEAGPHDRAEWNHWHAVWERKPKLTLVFDDETGRHRWPIAQDIVAKLHTNMEGNPPKWITFLDAFLAASETDSHIWMQYIGDPDPHVVGITVGKTGAHGEFMLDS